MKFIKYRLGLIIFLNIKERVKNIVVGRVILMNVNIIFWKNISD